MADWDAATAEKWWIEFRRPRVSIGTINTERYRLQHFVRVFQGKKLREITGADLGHYQNVRLSEGRSNSSINKRRNSGAGFRTTDRLPNPASDVGRAITREELRRLAIVAETHVDWEAAFYGSVLAANTGLRGGRSKNSNSKRSTWKKAES